MYTPTMDAVIKKIPFSKKKPGHDFFDLLNLNDILQLKPKDHNQFEHHKISFYVIILATAGKGTHSINYREYSYKKGTVFTLRQDNIHKFYHSRAKGKVLVFTEDFIIHYADKVETLRSFQLFNEMLGTPKLQLGQQQFVEIEKITQQIEREFSTSDDEFSIRIIRSLLQVLILKLIRIKSGENNHSTEERHHLNFIRLQELVQQEWVEHKKVNHYALQMNVTTKTLNNITQRVIGKSAKSFIDEIVTLQIKRLLINSPLSFKEVAYKAGFSDPTNFFKYFRKQTGLSPSQFKEELH